jgi:hypothetical protein
MKVQCDCPKCEKPIEFGWKSGENAEITCPTCHEPFALNPGASLQERNVIERCPMCESDEMYCRKDFPQGIGLGVVVVAAICSFAFLKSNLLLSWACLLAAVAIDMVLFYMVGIVTCCYRCKAEFRGVARNEAHAGFDLATAEKYG